MISRNIELLPFPIYYDMPRSCLHLATQREGEGKKTIFVFIFTSFSLIHVSKNYIICSRPERWIVTIPSSDQWLATIGNHWKTIATNGFGEQKPLKNHC